VVCGDRSAFVMARVVLVGFGAHWSRISTSSCPRLLPVYYRALFSDFVWCLDSAAEFPLKFVGHINDRLWQGSGVSFLFFQFSFCHLFRPAAATGAWSFRLDANGSISRGIFPRISCPRLMWDCSTGTRYPLLFFLGFHIGRSWRKPYLNLNTEGPVHEPDKCGGKYAPGRRLYRSCSLNLG